MVLIQALIISLAFTIRYTALYYPLVALVGLVISRYKPSLKIVGFLLSLALMLPFYRYTQLKTKEVTGTAEFSVFGGWQIANNALYMYDHIQVDSNLLPLDTKELDRVVRDFYKKVPKEYREFDPFPGTYFIKVPYAVLKPYMKSKYSVNNASDQFLACGKVSPIYRKYGTYLIMQHPGAFMRYYLWLNTKNYFVPHLEKFGSYNVLSTQVTTAVQNWFDYIVPDIHAVSATAQGKIFYIYPMIFMLLNVFYIAKMIILSITGGAKKMSLYFKKTLFFISSFLIVNFVFSILATPVVLRYQIVPFIILLAYSLLLLEFPENQNQTDNSKIVLE